MTNQYQVKVFLCDFDVSRAAEMKVTLKIYHNSQGNLFFKELLRQVKAGEPRLVYETNNETDAKQVANTLARIGGSVMIEGLKEEDEF